MAEDRLRSALEASTPSPDRLLNAGEVLTAAKRRHRRRRSALAAAAAGVLALGMGGALAALRVDKEPRDARLAGTSPIAAECPATVPVDGQLAQVPAIGPEVSYEHLVPAHAPESAVVCRYEMQDARVGRSEARLRDQESLSGLSSIPEDLDLHRRIPEGRRGCTLIAGVPTPYLLGLTYGDSVWWVAATEEPNHCAGATNGRFVTDVDLGTEMSTALLEGRWPVQRPPDDRSCARGRGGRAGTERVLVPAGARRIRVCDDDQFKRVVRDSGDIADAGRLLDKLDSEPGGACQLTSQPVGPPLVLLFDYPTGRPVTVRVDPGCDPQVIGDVLTARLSDAEFRELKRLLGLQ